MAAAMPIGMAIGVLKYPLPAEGAGEERDLLSGGAGELMGIEGSSESTAPVSMQSSAQSDVPGPQQGKARRVSLQGARYGLPFLSTPPEPLLALDFRRWIGRARADAV